MPDFIFHIPNYVENSNGIQTLWEAAYRFSKIRNVKISPYYAGEIRKYEIPSKYQSLVCVEAKKPQVESIVIYPDACHGNPLVAKNVARYLLAKEYILDGHEINYSSNDFIFSYSNAVSTFCPQYNILLENLKDIKNYQATKKSKISVYYGKCRVANQVKNFSKLLSKFDEVVIITRSNPSDKNELYKEIAESQLFISFDPLTSLSYEATLLGTPALLVDGVFKEYYDSYNYPLHGFHYLEDTSCIEDIISKSVNLIDQANAELNLQLGFIDKKTEFIVTEMERFFRKKQHANNLRLIKEDDRKFFINKWECSPILNCTTLNTVCALHLLHKSPLTFGLISAIFTTKLNIKRLIYKTKSLLVSSLKFLLRVTLGNAAYALIAYKVNPKRHINRFASKCSSSSFNVTSILRPNAIYNLITR